MKRKIIISSVLVLLCAASFGMYSMLAPATCSGGKNCNACKNCKYCKHCAKDGGTCSVCK